MSAAATRGGRGRVHAAIEFVLRSVADKILIVLTQSDLVLLAAVRVVRIRRRAVASPYPPHLKRRDAHFKIAQYLLIIILVHSCILLRTIDSFVEGEEIQQKEKNIENL